MGGISIRGRSGGVEPEKVSRKQSGVCVRVKYKEGVVVGEEPTQILGPEGALI